MCKNKGSSHGLLTCVPFSMISVTSLISISSPSCLWFCLVLQMEVLRGSSYQGPDRWHTNTYSPSVILHRSIRCASGFSIIIQEPLCTAVSQNPLTSSFVSDGLSLFIHTNINHFSVIFFSFFFGNYTQRLVGPGCFFFYLIHCPVDMIIRCVLICIFIWPVSHFTVKSDLGQDLRGSTV